MRISDWSSDVCSSDLVAAAACRLTMSAKVQTTPAAKWYKENDDGIDVDWHCSVSVVRQWSERQFQRFCDSMGIENLKLPQCLAAGDRSHRCRKTVVAVS